MGFLGKLFEKKECAICGGEIGLLGNRKLEDGDMCKNCAKKLSPWFNERRHSTVDEIKRQLVYREENRNKVAGFCVTRSFGEYWRVLLDDAHRCFTVTHERDLAEANPDILNYTDLTGCRMDIDEHETELERKDENGKMVSYDPPRYEYSYDFDIILTVNNPYFDEIRFRLNSSSVEVVNQQESTFGGSIMGQLLNAGTCRFDPNYDPKYRKYRQMADELVAAMNAIVQNSCRQHVQEFVQPNTAAVQQDITPVQPTVASTGPWICPSCGGQNEAGKFCESCGTPRPQ